MSKVIKSNKLILEEKTLSSLCPRIRVIGEGEREGTTETIPSPQEEAQQILHETETMVRELIEKARSQALELVEQAQQEAVTIVEEAQEQRDDIYEEARNRAYEEAIQRAWAEVEEAKEALEIGQRRLEEERALAIIKTEREVISLALKVAEKLIKQELSLDPSLVIRYVQEAISKAVNQEELTVYVNPDSAPIVNSYIEELSQVDSVKRKIAIVSDSSLLPGSCVVETALGKVDYRFERQLDDLKEVFEDVLVDG